MSVEQIGRSKLLPPGVMPGHEDLELLARGDWRYTLNSLFGSLADGMDISSAPLQSADLDNNAAIDRIRVALWGFKHEDHERKHYTAIIQRSLGFASVLAAELQSYDWRSQGAPEMRLPVLDNGFYGLRSQIMQESADYLSQRGHLKYMVQFFLGEAVTQDPKEQWGARTLVGFGLKLADEALQEHFMDAQTAPLSRQIEEYGVLPADPHGQA